MPEERPDYSDPQDKVDYQVVKSYGLASKSPARFLNSYTVAVFVIIVILLLMIFSQASTIKNLETRVRNLEVKVTELDKRNNDILERLKSR
jgi:hypothetical protein